MRLVKAIQQNKKLRTLGIDDAPFEKQASSQVNFSGIVCTQTRFEGMLWGKVTRDGDDATDVLLGQIKGSKFYSQLHAVMLDGIALGGFNVIDLPLLSEALALPCIAVMRKAPDFSAIDNALDHVINGEQKKARMAKAGEVYERENFVFQCAGCSPEEAIIVLQQTTDTGLVPEPLRLAHLIGSAVKTGESSRRA